jgi:glutamate 5-kinase
VHETTHQPLLSTLSAIVETVVRLRAAGHKVVLVSSGAIGVGLQRMSMPARPKSLSGKQASQLSISFMRLTLIPVPLPTARHWPLSDKVD